MIQNTGLSPLVALVCGFEKSGTTLLNEILRRHPALDSGFEVGVLLADSPRDFKTLQPYYSFFRSTWKLTPEDTEYLCDTDHWGEFYRRSRERSPLITDKHSWIFDKTPAYMRELSSVLEKVPGLPCVVNVRDPRALMLSWARWSGHEEHPAQWIEENFQAYVDRYAGYADGYYSALAEYHERILLNRFELLCTDPDASLKRIFKFIGLEFQQDYLSFNSEHFVYGNTVSRQYIAPYVDLLSDELCQRILEATGKYSDWHFDPPSD
jgi:hypothetical protein